MVKAAEPEAELATPCPWVTLDDLPSAKQRCCLLSSTVACLDLVFFKVLLLHNHALPKTVCSYFCVGIPKTSTALSSNCAPLN